jgi:two-component sensor histidine kinase
MYATGLKAMDELSETLYSKMRNGDDMKAFANVYQEWLSIHDKHMVALFETDEYSKLMAEVSSLQLTMKKKIEKEMEKSMSHLPVINRTEMDELYQTVYELKKRINMLEKQLDTETVVAEEPKAAAKKTAKNALEEAVRRVASIAIVHETLSNSSTESVAFDEVYDRIVHNAIELSTHKIHVKKVGTFGTFDSQVATPLALVITELIHNALEHGLANSGENLRVEVSRKVESCEVRVIDDGIGLPQDFKWDQSSNLGLQIVKTLTENELKGSIELIRVGSETQAVLKF